MLRSRFTYLIFLFLLLASIGWAQTPLSFVPTGPCRVVDTRLPAGPFGGPMLAAGTSRDFIFPDNPACAIPTTAEAYAVNVTVVPTGYLGYVTLWPTGQDRPTISTMNSFDGRYKAVAAIVPAGTGHNISAYTTNNTHLVLDIVGYFVGPGNEQALYYHPYVPSQGQTEPYCELINTVDPPRSNGLGGPALVGGLARSFQVTNTLNCSMPWDAEAYSLNITATPVNGKPLSYVTVWPTDQAQPLVSTLNAPTGTTVSNAAIVKAGTGALSIYATADTNIEVYLTGWFGRKHASGTDAFYAVAPCRGLDTRPTNFVQRFDYVLQSEGGCLTTLPVIDQRIPDISAFVLNATVVPNAGLGYFPIWQHNLGMPTPSTLYALDGAVTSNMAIVPATKDRRGLDVGQISAYASAATNLLYDVFGYFASPELTILTMNPMPETMTANVPYQGTIMKARGGVPPYTWSADGLPDHVNIDASTGQISGCPTSPPDNATPTIYVKDSSWHQNQARLDVTTVTLTQLDPLTMSQSSLPTGYHNQWYSTTLACTGGYGPFTWALDSGQLPPDFTLTPDGVISGFASTPGRWDFTVKVTDSRCHYPVTITEDYHITIQN